MKVLNLPFSKKNQIQKSDKAGYLLMIPFSEKISNHLNTVHGSASFSLAETTSGYYLNSLYSDIADSTIPILRASCIKYKKPVVGNLYSKAKLKDTTCEDILLGLRFKKKALFTIEVKLYNESNQLVVISDYEWFVTMK